MHLFDIDIPGKMTFKESLTLSPGEGPTVVDTEVRVVLRVCGAAAARGQERGAERACLLPCFRRAQRRGSGESVAVPPRAQVGRLGVGICYDIRFPELAWIYAQRGCQLLVYPGVHCRLGTP